MYELLLNMARAKLRCGNLFQNLWCLKNPIVRVKTNLNHFSLKKLMSNVYFALVKDINVILQCIECITYGQEIVLARKFSSCPI